MSPRVSVVIPAYRHGAYIDQCLQSVLAQTYRDFDVTVIDDGSPDDTFERARRYASTGTPRVVVERQPNAGVAATLNRGIRSTKGEFVAILASDDYMASGRLAAQVAAFDAQPEVGVVHTDVDRVDLSGGPVGRLLGSYTPATGVPFMEFLMGRVGICAPSATFRRTVFDAVEGFDESVPLEDAAFYLAAAAHGVSFAFIPEPLTFYRVTPGSLGRSTAKYWRDSLRVYEKYLPRLSETDRARVKRRFFRYQFQSAVYQSQYSIAAELAPAVAESIDLSLETAKWALGVAARKGAQAVLPESVHFAMKRAFLAVTRLRGRL